MVNVLTRRRVVVMGLFLAILTGILLLRSRSRGELEEWQRAMEAKGEKFSLVEVAPPLSQAAQDWEIRFSNAVSRLTIGTFHPSSIEMMRSVGTGRAQAAWQQRNPFQDRRPDTDDVWPDFIEQMQSNEPVLAEIRTRLVNRPAGSVDDPTNPFARGKGVSLIARRTAAQHLAGAVIAELHSGRVDSALTNLHALMAFSRLHDEGGLLVDRMIGVAIAGLALSCTWEALQAPGWDEARLASLQAAWEAADILKGFHRTAEMERAFAFAAFELARTNQSGSPGLFATGGSPPSSLAEWLEETMVSPIWRSTWFERDALLCLQVTQPLIEGLRAAETNVGYSVIRARWKEGRALLDVHQGWLDRYRYQLTQVALPNWEKALLSAWKQETLRRLAITAMALRRCQLRHGRMPERLDELAPRFLSIRPVDPMSGGQALFYQRGADDRMELRSVGENGRDDGGQGDDVIWPQLAPANER
jgi:hypothetical protein